MVIFPMLNGYCRLSIFGNDGLVRSGGSLRKPNWYGENPLKASDENVFIG